jgi:hypothetical protein
MSRPYRDEELGAALRELEAPEHGPGFDAALAQRLAEERRARAAARRRTRTRWGVLAAALVVAAAVAAVGIPRLAKGPEPATAAEVQEHVRQALAGMRTLSGTLVDDGARWQFALTAEGDLWLAGPGQGEVIAYDAQAGVVRSAQRSASLGGGPLFYAERRGVAPGLPDAGAPALILPRGLGAYVRALLAADDPRVREVVHDGRPAWRVDVETVPNAIVPEFSGDSLEITVDRETGMPVQVVERKGNAVLRTVRVQGLRIDVELPAGTFRPRFPRGAEVMRSDDGFRRVELAEAAGVVGYDPLVPAWVPEGYELAEVAVARRAGPTGTEAGNPPSRMVVSLSYRRGLDQFLVTTRLARPGETWDDPLATGEGFVDEPERVRIGAGALRGAEAELVLAPRGIPHLWARTDSLVVTIGGDLSRAELVRVAESLSRPAPR